MTDPVQKQYLDPMQKLGRQLDEILNGRRKPGKARKLGFVLLIAEFGKIGDGRVNYISNGEREDMVAMLREYLARHEGRYHEPTGEGRVQWLTASTPQQCRSSVMLARWPAMPWHGFRSPITSSSHTATVAP